MTQRRQQSPRKSHLANAINQNVKKSPLMGVVWVVIWMAFMAFAMIAYFSK